MKDYKEQLDPLSFWKKYQLVAEASNYYQNPILKTKCRFCGQTSDATSFSQVTHLIPEAIGQNSIISYEECDTCNKTFGKYESHLSRYALPYLTFTGTSTKNGVPQFRSRSDDDHQKIFTSVKLADNGKREIAMNDTEDCEVDFEKKEMRIKLKIPPFKPFYVFKSLMKIGLSLLPNETLPEYDSAFKWLLGGINELDVFPSFIAVSPLRFVAGLCATVLSGAYR